jgi:hypothetical protein
VGIVEVHSGIDGLVPADRYFGAAGEVKQALQARVAANALTLARHCVPRPPLYLTGQVCGNGEGPRRDRLTRHLLIIELSGVREGGQVVLVRPAGTTLVLHVLHYPEQVRVCPQTVWPLEKEPAEELRLAGMLIEAAGGKVDWTVYPDQAAEELKALIEAKLAGQARFSSLSINASSTPAALAKATTI